MGTPLHLHSGTAKMNRHETPGRKIQPATIHPRFHFGLFGKTLSKLQLIFGTESRKYLAFDRPWDSQRLTGSALAGGTGWSRAVKRGRTHTPPKTMTPSLAWNWRSFAPLIYAGPGTGPGTSYPKIEVEIESFGGHLASNSGGRCPNGEWGQNHKFLQLVNNSLECSGVL